MKKFIAVYALAILASCASFAPVSPPASADSICFNTFAPTPVPVQGHPTLGLCVNNILQTQVVGPGGSPLPTSGPTAAPGPTDANGIPLVHPTAVPTQTIQGCTGCVAVPVSIATSLAII